ncbi:MAG TPA: SMP-30/gluconolactonase/LRE family protein [Tepidisphaeraceae bacterium]|jgi:hypothetical protein|nr:SMP-30/gluconolactonase/LRE family protein [Tepidisphaeraceae bacterium]
MHGNVICSNGADWSPDGRTMYHTESFRYSIFAYDFNPATGSLANRRAFAEIDRTLGAFPDGLCVDAEGGVWSNQVGIGRVVRYDPAGRIERRIEFPVPRAVGCTFGGDDLCTLFVTSARETMTPPQLEHAPLSGAAHKIARDPVSAPDMMMAAVPAGGIGRRETRVLPGDTKKRIEAIDLLAPESCVCPFQKSVNGIQFRQVDVGQVRARYKFWAIGIDDGDAATAFVNFDGHGIFFPGLFDGIDRVVWGNAPGAMINSHAKETNRFDDAHQTTHIFHHQQVQFTRTKPLLDFLQFRAIQALTFTLRGNDVPVDRPIIQIRHNFFGVIDLIFQ